MGFLFFTLLLLPVVLLAALLRPFAPLFRPFLDWVTQPTVFYPACKIMIAFNLLLFAALLVIRFKWKRAGKLTWGYIHSVRGWEFLKRKLVRLLLTYGPIWVLGWAAIPYCWMLMEVVKPVP